MGTRDIPRDETCYIVFPATSLRRFERNPGGMEEAEYYASERARNTHEPHIILLVPSDFVDSGIIARYQGVILDALKESDLRNEK